MGCLLVLLRRVDAHRRLQTPGGRAVASLPRLKSWYHLDLDAGSRRAQPTPSARQQIPRRGWKQRWRTRGAWRCRSVVVRVACRCWCGWGCGQVMLAVLAQGQGGTRDHAIAARCPPSTQFSLSRSGSWKRRQGARGAQAAPASAVQELGPALTAMAATKEWQSPHRCWQGAEQARTWRRDGSAASAQQRLAPP